MFEKPVVPLGVPPEGDCNPEDLIYGVESLARLFEHVACLDGVDLRLLGLPSLLVSRGQPRKRLVPLPQSRIEHLIILGCWTTQRSFCQNARYSRSPTKVLVKRCKELSRELPPELREEVHEGTGLIREAVCLW